MRRALTSLVAASLALLPLGSASAQSQPANVLKIEEVQVDDHPSTRVVVSLPADVSKDAVDSTSFILDEDGERRDVTVSEAKGSDLQVLLLMDSTGSMGGAPIAGAKRAAAAFIRQLPADAKISVMSYETTADVVTPFSSNKARHLAGIEGLQAKGETAMYDALAKAVRQFPGGADSQRAVILLTDGEDNASDISLPGVTGVLRKSGATLYAVEYLTAFTTSGALRRMANATGGQVKNADDPEALVRVYDEIATALVNRYVLEYTSEASGAATVTVSLADGDAAATASDVVEFPVVDPVVEPPKPDPVLRIADVDLRSYPEVAVHVRPPAEVAQRSLSAETFHLVEGTSPQDFNVERRDDGTYVLRYLSASHGQTKVSVAISAGEIKAEATSTSEFPPLPPAQGFLGSQLSLMVGAGLAFVAMAVIFVMLLNPGRARARRSVLSALGSQRATRPSAVSGITDWATMLADRSLERGDRKKTLNDALEHAGVNLRASEFVVLAASVTITAGVAGFLLSGPVMGLLFGAFGALGCRFWLRFKATRRRNKFANQLSDTLQLLAGSLRAGYAVMQAVDAVSREADSPTAEEFRRLVVETRLGRDMTEALEAMGARVGNEDFKWVVQAIAINREVGGDLAEVLDTVGHTIRERNQIRRQVKALSAEGKLSAIVLVALPFCVGGLLLMSNPDYIGELTTSLTGWIMLFVGGLLMAFGTWWLKKIVSFRF